MRSHGRECSPCGRTRGGPPPFRGFGPVGRAPRAAGDMFPRPSELRIQTLRRRRQSMTRLFAIVLATAALCWAPVSQAISGHHHRGCCCAQPAPACGCGCGSSVAPGTPATPTPAPARRGPAAGRDGADRERSGSTDGPVPEPDLPELFGRAGSIVCGPRLSADSRHSAGPRALCLWRCDAEQ